MNNINSEGAVSFACGELQGSTDAAQCPDIPAHLIYITALADNAGNVYLGGSGVTVANGTTDVTTGIQLKPGASIGPLPLKNLNKLYRITDNAGDDITYMAIV